MAGAHRGGIRQQQEGKRTKSYPTTVNNPQVKKGGPVATWNESRRAGRAERRGGARESKRAERVKHRADPRGGQGRGGRAGGEGCVGARGAAEVHSRASGRGARRGRRRSGRGAARGKPAGKQDHEKRKRLRRERPE